MTDSSVDDQLKDLISQILNLEIKKTTVVNLNKLDLSIIPSGIVTVDEEYYQEMGFNHDYSHIVDKIKDLKIYNDIKTNNNRCLNIVLKIDDNVKKFLITNLTEIVKKYINDVQIDPIRLAILKGNEDIIKLARNPYYYYELRDTYNLNHTIYSTI